MYASGAFDGKHGGECTTVKEIHLFPSNDEMTRMIQRSFTIGKRKRKGSTAYVRTCTYVRVHARISFPKQSVSFTCGVFIG